MTRKKPTKPKAKPRAKPKADLVQDPDKLPDASKPLSNARHERFCQNMAMHGMTNGQAYILAGFAVTNPDVGSASATRLLKDIKLRARLVFLQHQAAALAIDVSSITKADVLNMVFEQHQRNVGLRPVLITKAIKTGKKKGELETVERYAYNEHAASQTLKLLNDEFGLGLGESGSRGNKDLDIAARAGVEDPDVAQDLDRLRSARRLALAGGTDVDQPKDRKKA